MYSIKRSVTIPGVILVLTLSAVVAYQAIAERGAFARPTAVVTVDLAAVIDGLDQRAEAAAELDQMQAEMRAEDEQWMATIEDLERRRNEAPEAEKAVLEEDMAKTALNYQAWGRFALEQRDLEISLRWRDLDRSIREAIAEMARIEGYDIVITDDSTAELSLNPSSNTPREAQVRQQMNARRILYVNPEVDVTDELIERMNNAYNAGG